MDNLWLASFPFGLSLTFGVLLSGLICQIFGNDEKKNFFLYKRITALTSPFE